MNNSAATYFAECGTIRHPLVLHPPHLLPPLDPPDSLWGVHLLLQDDQSLQGNHPAYSSPSAGGEHAHSGTPARQTGII